MANQKKELVLLLAALTKGGKTAVATALCHPNVRSQMAALGNNRTEVTVDWAYDPNKQDIKLLGMLVNYRGVFGTDEPSRITCEKFSEILDTEEGSFLVRFIGLKKQSGLTSKALEQYVLSTIDTFIGNCSIDSLVELIRNRVSNRFFRRIKVALPPCDDFANLMKAQDASLVLRDTRGFLDLDPDEAQSIKNKTMQELGIDGIDAVLLLGTSTPFPDIVNWYKNSYKSAFKSVPIFIMTRSDSVSMLFRILFKGPDTINAGNVKVFLGSIKRNAGKGYSEFAHYHLPSYRLLELFGLGRVVDGSDFSYNYKVYDNKDLRYVYPYSTTLASDSVNPDYNSADYRLFELIVLENLIDITKKMIEHNNFIEAIYGQIKSDFITTVCQSKATIPMYPSYRLYDRIAVCKSIITDPVLGPRDGIVTVTHGQVRYLGAITSAVSSRIWLESEVRRYIYSGTLQNPDGSNMVLHMPKDCRDNLVRMALLKIIEENTDYFAIYRGYYFIERAKVSKAVLDVRDSDKYKALPGDALDHAIKAVATHVFQ